MIERFFSTKEVAKQTGNSTSYYEKLRCRGGGPRFIRIGRCIRYKESDLIAWLEQHPARRSTSDAA